VFLRTPPEIPYGNAVAAPVVIGDSMERHMQIADKRDNITQRVGTLVWVGVFFSQDMQLICNGLRDAPVGARELRQRARRSAKRNVDIVPGTILGVAAYLVGPSRSVRYLISCGIAAIAFEF
jgi:hypothetical protein